MEFKNPQNGDAEHVKRCFNKTFKRPDLIVILVSIIAVIVLIGHLSSISKAATSNDVVSSELPDEIVKNPADIKEKTVNQPQSGKAFIPSIGILKKVKEKFPDNRPIEITESENLFTEKSTLETTRNKPESNPEINTLSEPNKETTSNRHTLKSPVISHNYERYLYDQAIPHFNRGFKYFNNEQFQLAITEFKQTLQIKPDYQSAKNALDRAYKSVEEENKDRGKN